MDFKGRLHVRMASAVNLLKRKRLIIIILSTGNVLIKEYELEWSSDRTFTVENNKQPIGLRAQTGTWTARGQRNDCGHKSN